MATNKDTTKVTLGNGDLFLNGVDVGHLKGTVEFIFELTKKDFKPANMLGAVKQFIIGEMATLKASLAELKVPNIKLAMGIGSTIGASQSFPNYDPSTYSPAAGSSWDVLTFGGDKSVAATSLRFEHTRQDGTVFVVVFYSAVTEAGLNLPFNEEDVTLHDVVFKGLALAGRTAGDQIGFVADQVQSA